MIDLPLGSLAVKKLLSIKASSRWALFTMGQPGVVAGNFAVSFSLNFLSIFVHISGAIRLIFCLLRKLSIDDANFGH